VTRCAKGLADEHIFLTGDKDTVLFKELSQILGRTCASGRAEEIELPDSEE